MRVFLAGNPNVGKSVVFNRLTGANVIVSNYAGTTVEFTKGQLRVGDRKAEVVDVPGTYSLDPTSKAEEVAVQMLAAVTGEDVIVNVVDATSLERSLHLTLELIRLGKPMVVALNLWDETKHTGVKIDVRKLEELLDTACVPLVAITGVGIKTLVEHVERARISSRIVDGAERWREIGRIIESVQTITHRHHSIFDKLADASVRPFSGALIAALVLLAMFEIIRGIGEGLINHVFGPLFENLWAPVVLKFSVWMGGKGLFHDILIGKLTDGAVDFGESFGLLTTGLFVPFAAVLPYVFAFYLVLSILEDIGYLPRLAVLADTVMHRMGLHGMGIIPMILGLGCNVPGVLAGRIMESRKERFIAMTLMAIAVPCMAQTSMIIGLAGAYGAKALAPIFGTLFLVWLTLGRILHRTVKGDSPEILLDMPPYRLPYLPGLAKKVGMRIVWFLREAVPWVLAGVLLVNILHTLGVIAFVARIAAPVVTGLWGLPADAAGALVIGFLRKDVAVGMLMPLHLSLRQIIVASVVLAMYFPCIATFVVMAKELGAMGTIKATAIMLGSALTVGGLLDFVQRVVLNR